MASPVVGTVGIVCRYVLDLGTYMLQMEKYGRLRASVCGYGDPGSWRGRWRQIVSH